MSNEQLLFFLLLVAFPLLERLIRALRARTAGSSVVHSPAPAPERVSRPLPLPPAPTQVIPHAAPEQLRVPERPPALRRVIARGELRHAIVVMAVLGPCRALEPEDASPTSRV